MLQGDFNHMANIVTLLFEQIIDKNIEKDVDMNDTHHPKGILIYWFIHN